MGGLLKRGKEESKSPVDKNAADTEGGNLRESRRRSGIGIRNGHRGVDGSRSRSTSRRGSEILRRNEDHNSSLSSATAAAGGNVAVGRRAKASLATTAATTRKTFMYAVQEGIRKRAEKTKKNDGRSNSTTSGSTIGKEKKVTGTTATATVTPDIEVLEMSAERLLMMAEAVVVAM